MDILAADPIKNLIPPGGQLVYNEHKDSGHPTESPFGQGRPTVERNFSFIGDHRAAAMSVTKQARQAGWSARLDCSLQEDNVYFVRGGKRFEDFSATLKVHILTLTTGKTHPEPRVDIEISAPFPGEEPSATGDTANLPAESDPVVCEPV